MKQRAKKRASTKQERLIARENRGLIASGSGNGKFVKGDVTTKEFKIEAKRTDNAHSISLKREWLTKVSSQAFSERRLPALAIEFGGSSEQFYVLRADEFQLLVSYLRE